MYGGWKDKQGQIQCFFEVLQLILHTVVRTLSFIWHVFNIRTFKELALPPSSGAIILADVLLFSFLRYYFEIQGNLGLILVVALSQKMRTRSSGKN
jgi:hypothetical protein